MKPGEQKNKREKYKITENLTFYRNAFTAGLFSTAPLPLVLKDDGLSCDLTRIRYTYSFIRTSIFLQFILWIGQMLDARRL